MFKLGVAKQSVEVEVLGPDNKFIIRMVFPLQFRVDQQVLLLNL